MTAPIDPTAPSTHPGGWLGEWLDTALVLDDAPEMVYIGRTIMTARTALGLKRKDLAKRAQVSYPYLAEIETGTKAPSMAVLLNICAVLRLTRAQLLANARWLAHMERAAQEAK